MVKRFVKNVSLSHDPFKSDKISSKDGQFEQEQANLFHPAVKSRMAFYQVLLFS